MSFFKKALGSNLDADTKERALYWMAESFLARGMKSEAYKKFGSVLENTNTTMDQPALLKKGIILFEQNRMKSAARIFQKAEEGYSENIYTERAREWRKEAEAQIKDEVEINSGADQEKER